MVGLSARLHRNHSGLNRQAQCANEQTKCCLPFRICSEIEHLFNPILKELMTQIQMVPWVLLGLAPIVFAQQAPNSGAQMQQIPVAPLPPVSKPEPMRMKPVDLPKNERRGDVSMEVKALQIQGANSFSESDLIAQTGFQSGGQLTLAQLRGMSDRIADFYHQRGFFVAQVYLPPQNIQSGVVTLIVLEGRYGQVILQNESRASDATLSYFIKDFASGDAILSAPLERQLLLMSDTPGVVVNSTLVPGRTLGSSDLFLKTTAGPRVNGSIDADNAGNRYTGTTRAGATINVNELLGYGDVTSLRVLSSGHGLQYARGAYQGQIGEATAGLAYSDLRYVLGREFESLGAHGSQKIASLYASYPLMRARTQNLSAGLSFDSKRFEDVVDASSSLSHKHANVLSASLRGDASDKTGNTAYGLSWATGHVDLKDAGLQVIDAATARTQGHFNKLSFNANRLQKISETVTFYASLNGQLASKNLDVSEKMELGGMYGVRAFPEGEAFADKGYLLTLESRLQLNALKGVVPGQMQLIGFVDTGTVHANQKPWTTGDNRRTLSGAGIGVNWFQARDYMVRAYYAFKLGNEIAVSAPDAKGRFWVQGVKYF